uniref:Uncharacterized protein n=1 Tax=Nothobranchius furzeri TaxID=105023 RepID=A0A8C6NUX6_NOTFU
HRVKCGGQFLPHTSFGSKFFMIKLLQSTLSGVQPLQYPSQTNDRNTISVLHRKVNTDHFLAAQIPILLPQKTVVYTSWHGIAGCEVLYNLFHLILSSFVSLDNFSLDFLPLQLETLPNPSFSGGESVQSNLIKEHCVWGH